MCSNAKSKGTNSDHAQTIESTNYADTETIADAAEFFEDIMEEESQPMVLVSFVYSHEVRNAVAKMKESRDKKSQFNKNDVHIFHLPEIIRTCANNERSE